MLTCKQNSTISDNQTLLFLVIHSHGAEKVLIAIMEDRCGRPTLIPAFLWGPLKYDETFSLSKAEAAKAAEFLLTSFSLAFFFFFNLLTKLKALC